MSSGVTPADGLARLEAAADAGELDVVCERFGVVLMTVFGSAARRDPAARDLDVAVLGQAAAFVQERMA